MTNATQNSAKKVHNFYAGPSILFPQTYEESINAINNFAGTGLSILEISHRSKEFVEVMENARQIVKDLIGVPQGYHVLYLGGGASTQFMMTAYNLLEKKAAYLETGKWAANAIKEAKVFGEVVLAGSSADKNYNYIPKNIHIPEDADYFHYTSNNTIYGTQIRETLHSPIPMVCDMSSDIMSRRVDVSKYALIYAGAQKNMGPSGATVVIVREDILGKVSRKIPTILNYSTHIKKDSMYNTPPVFPVFAILKNLEYVKKIGGVDEMQRRAKERADMLYAEIDRNPLFRAFVPEQHDRSQMNVSFFLEDESLTEEFLAACKEAKIMGIKGYRDLGGFRASLYNALPIESVQALINVMQTFK